MYAPIAIGSRFIANSYLHIVIIHNGLCLLFILFIIVMFIIVCFSSCLFFILFIIHHETTIRK